MARKLEEWQQQELTAFVNAIADAAGYKKTADWARDSGYPASNLSDLRNAKAGVDGFNLLRLIRAAADRSGQTAEDLAQATADESPESIRLHLAKLTTLVTSALEQLEALAAPPERAGGRKGQRGQK